MNTSKRKVAHFLRKNTQLKASFIRNQIASHNQYVPVLVWRTRVDKLHDGGFANFNKEAYQALDLSIEQSFIEKLHLKGLKILTNLQIKAIQQFLAKQRVDICHFHYGTDCGVFYPLLKKINIPSVVSFYGYDCSSFPYFLFGYGSQYLKSRVFKDINAVLAMSPDMKKDLVQAGCPEHKVIVHYYGTDCTRFRIERSYSSKDEVTLLILASLVPQKGHLFLLQSLLKLKEYGIRNWKLRIVGVGELEETLKAFVQKNNLSRHVVFVGAVGYTSPEMMQEYKRADIFVHPSVVAPNGDKEGIPGTVIEAMATGLPVVTTYHAGIPYIIKSNETGWLVEEWDVNALETAIRSLILNAALRERLGRAGQAFALKELELRHKEIELEEIYTQLVDNKKVTKETCVASPVS